MSGGGPRALLGNGLRNRLRRLANLLDPGRRLRRLPQRLRARRFRAAHTVLTAADAGALIARRIGDGTPSAIGKIGNSELRLLLRWRRAVRRGREPRFPGWLREEAMVGPGLFPADDATLARAAALWLERLRAVDLLAVWHNRGEAEILRAHGTAAAFTEFAALEPYRLARPWTRALAGRRVAVVTPFPRTVLAQYARRRDIWGTHAVLPDLDLRVVEVPFGPALVPPAEPDWFARLAALEARLEREPFDVALIGAGALSIPLCAHAKALGRIGIHTGGATQVLFGIRGRRFEAEAHIAPLMNAHWVRPLPEETPARCALVENAAYW
jgi:hypothetical protein